VEEGSGLDLAGWAALAAVDSATGKGWGSAAVAGWGSAEETGLEAVVEESLVADSAKG